MEQLSEAQMQNYTLISKIGEGAFAQVILAKQNLQKTLCALKMIEKTPTANEDQQKITVMERQTLPDLYHPFVIKMHQAFQTRNYFCIALEYCPGGDLFDYLYSGQPFSEKKISLYAAQLVLAIEYLHTQNIIFRDLKPENILIGKDGYLKLTDFGMAKSNISTDYSKTFSLCGSSEYMAPETIENLGHGRAFDWWTLGCCLYEMLYQTTPFYSDEKSQMFDKILNQQPTFTNNPTCPLKDLIMQLLNKNPLKRLQFSKKIKNHEFFANINFEKLYRKQYLMPYVPQYVRGKKMLKIIKEDVEIFTQLEDSETPKASYVADFDYKCGQSDQETFIQEQHSEQKMEKASTEDQEDAEEKKEKEGFAETLNRKWKQMWETF